MSISSTLAEMMPRVMMTGPWGVIGIVGNGGSAAGSVTGTRTEENAAGPDLVSAADVLVPARERGRETDQLQEEMMPLVVAGVESEKGNVGGQREETAGVGRGVENVREGAGVGIAKGTEKGARDLMERKLLREMERPRVSG